MKLLVTGGAGFIGNCFAGMRINAGDEVVILDALTYAGDKKNLDWFSDKANFQFIHGNICDSDLVLKILRENEIDAVINFAAESHVDNSIASSAAFIETNIIGVHRMLEASRTYYNELDSEKQKNFRFIQISTDEVYGSLSDFPELMHIKFTEQSQYQPNSPYSASKAAGDHLAKAWHETYGLPTIVTNCSNNYGKRQHHEKLIPLMINHALSGKNLPIYGDGKNIRDWIYVEDHCEGIYLALTKGKIGETYCFGGRAETQNITIINKICDILDRIHPRKDGVSYHEQKNYVTDRAGHDRRYAIDDTKAETELGFTRKYNLDEALQVTVEYYLDRFLKA